MRWEMHIRFISLVAFLLYYYEFISTKRNPKWSLRLENHYDLHVICAHHRMAHVWGWYNIWHSLCIGQWQAKCRENQIPDKETKRRTERRERSWSGAAGNGAVWKLIPVEEQKQKGPVALFPIWPRPTQTAALLTQLIAGWVSTRHKVTTPRPHRQPPAPQTHTHAHTHAHTHTHKNAHYKPMQRSQYLVWQSLPRWWRLANIDRETTALPICPFIDSWNSSKVFKFMGKDWKSSHKKVTFSLYQTVSHINRATNRSCEHPPNVTSRMAESH